MARQRYPNYRGKGRKGPVLAVMCVVLVLAAAYGFVWLFEHMSMNADGTVTVNLPGFLSPEPDPTPDPEPNPLEIVVAPPSTVPVTEAPEQASESSLTPAPPRSVLVSQGAIGTPSALAQLKADAQAAGADTFVIDYKSDEGDVLTREEWDAAAAALGPEYRYIARISLFLDNTMPRQRNSLAVKHVNGMNWLGPDGRWLNPFRDEAADYLLTVIDHAAALGADGILLDNLCFPWYGKLEQISYGNRRETPRIEAIEAFCTQLEGLGLLIPVSVVALRDTALNGSHEVAGQSLELLKSRFSAVYVEWPDPLEPLGEGLVPILAGPLADPGPEGNGWMMVMGQSEN